jgi:hypothetical protein
LRIPDARSEKREREDPVAHHRHDDEELDAVDLNVAGPKLGLDAVVQWSRHEVVGRIHGAAGTGREAVDVVLSEEKLHMSATVCMSVRT